MLTGCPCSCSQCRKAVAIVLPHADHARRCAERPGIQRYITGPADALFFPAPPPPAPGASGEMRSHGPTNGVSSITSPTTAAAKLMELVKELLKNREPGIGTNFSSGSGNGDKINWYPGAQCQVRYRHIRTNKIRNTEHKRQQDIKPPAVWDTRKPYTDVSASRTVFVEFEYADNGDGIEKHNHEGSWCQQVATFRSEGKE